MTIDFYVNSDCLDNNFNSHHCKNLALLRLPVLLRRFRGDFSFELHNANEIHFPLVPCYSILLNFLAISQVVLLDEIGQRLIDNFFIAFNAAFSWFWKMAW
jgi:hypothetical protein